MIVPKVFGSFVRRHWKKAALSAHVVKLFELIPLDSHELITEVTYISTVSFTRSVLSLPFETYLVKNRAVMKSFSFYEKCVERTHGVDRKHITFWSLADKSAFKCVSVFLL